MAHAPASSASDPTEREPAPAPAEDRVKILHILILAGAAAISFGIIPTVVLSWSAVPSLAYGYLATLALFPAGWLGDRYLGARRATLLGGVMALVMVLCAIIKSPLTAPIALAAALASAALLGANLPVVLGRSYRNDDPRRLSGFVWLNGAWTVGFLVAAAVKDWEINPPVLVWGTCFLLVVAVTLFIGGISVGGALQDEETPAPTARGKASTASMAIALLLGSGIFYFSRFFPESRSIAAAFAAICVAIPASFILWLWSRKPAAHGPLSKAQIGALSILLAASFALFGLSAAALGFGVDAGAELGVPRLVEQSPAFIALVLALLLTRFWRRLRETAVAAARTIFGISFLLIGGAFLPAALVIAVVAPEASPILWINVLVATWAVMDAVVSASALHAATTVARPGYAGRTVAAWRLVVSAGSRSGPLLLPSGAALHPPVAIAVAACCLLIGLLLLPHRQAAEAPVTARRGRIRRLAIRLAAVSATASVAWAVVGRYSSASLTALTAPVVTFNGAEGLYLPDDATHGFVRLSASSARSSGSLAAQPDPRVNEGTAFGGGLSAFSIGKYEVTVAQYRACVDAGGCRPADPRATTEPDNFPVRFVTWVDAVDYCRWLEQSLARIAPQLLPQGMHVTLPSEPEWEHAAGGATRTYPWMGPLTPERANYANSGHLAPVPVGEFAAGATSEGVQDLAGNVAEWTRSEYRPYPYDPIDGRELMVDLRGARVIRGGSFYDSESLLRVTSRQAADPNRGYDFVGFRVVLGANGAPPPPAVKRQ